jgi:hypothetical protein
MSSGKMMRHVVVLQEGRLVLRQRILLTKQAPYLILIVRRSIIELHLLQTGKLFDERIIDDEVLLAILEVAFYASNFLFSFFVSKKELQTSQ